MLRASPKADSGSHARRREAAAFEEDLFEEDDVGRVSVGAVFCCRRAI